MDRHRSRQSRPIWRYPSTPHGDVDPCLFPFTGTSIHDRLGQMVGPPSRMVVGPQARIDLWYHNLQVRWPDVVDLFAQEGGSVNAMRTDLYLPSAVARNHLMRIDRPFQFW